MPIVKTYYKVHRVFPDPDYFYMENISGKSVTLDIAKYGTPASTDLSYSFDKVTWTDIHDGGLIANVADGAKVYFRSSTGLNSSLSDYFYFDTSYEANTSYNAGGHIATLFNYNDVSSITAIPGFGCCQLFRDSSVVHANIDFYGIKSIGNSGCRNMFIRAKQLLGIPDFSEVNTIGNNGFDTTFAQCTSLLTPADLTGVTAMGTSSLANMYNGCSLLADAIAPNVSSWNASAYLQWLLDTAATGVVRKPTGLTIPTDSTSGVPTGWATENY